MGFEVHRSKAKKNFKKLETENDLLETVVLVKNRLTLCTQNRSRIEAFYLIEITKIGQGIG